jgi:hypothetical protein
MANTTPERAVPQVVEQDTGEGTAEGRGRSALIWRLAAGAMLVVALAAYAVLVDEIPELPLWWDVALAAFVLIPATMALAWLALPLRTWDGVAALGVGLAAAALACALADLDILANLAKALAVILLALAFLNFFERPWWVGLVALAIPAVDALSVWRGPTRHIVEEEPEVFGLLSIAFPVPDGSFQLGLPDVLFFSLFLGAAARWRMRVPLSWLLMTSSFGATMALALWLDPFGLGGLPALPLLCLAFLGANGDRLLGSLRPSHELVPVRHLRPVPDPEPEPERRPHLAVGVAECDDGWIAAGLEDGRFAWAERRPTFAAALELAGEADVVGVEAVAGGERLGEIADRLYLGAEARRVYSDFLRKLMATRDDDDAAALVRELGWQGMTQESLAFRRRALEVAEHRGDERLVEVDGLAARGERLARAGIEVPPEAVRAAAAAWSATRSARGR